MSWYYWSENEGKNLGPYSKAKFKKELHKKRNGWAQLGKALVFEDTVTGGNWVALESVDGGRLLHAIEQIAIPHVAPPPKRGTTRPPPPQQQEQVDPWEDPANWEQLKTEDGTPYFEYTKPGGTEGELFQPSKPGFLVSEKGERKKPECLKGDDELETLEFGFWVPDSSPPAGHLSEGFLMAKLHGDQGARSATVIRMVGGREQRTEVQVSKTDEKRIFRLVMRNELPYDLVMMQEVDEANILHNLRRRYRKNMIYTSIGPILISVNPYQNLELYTPDILQQYKEPNGRRLQPHVFGIGKAAYKQLMDRGESQSVIISGESGAGKTEATKQVLQFLGEAAGSSPSAGGAGRTIADRILDTNPILEAFGNAKTVRNNNSSRFGKYCEVNFESSGRICGAKINNYLLEKSRVVTRGHGKERNYHIFYQILAAATDEEMGRFRLPSRDPGKYSILKCDNHHVRGIDDKKEYNLMNQAFYNIGITEEERISILSTVSAVLLISSVKLDEINSGGDIKAVVSKESTKAVQDAAELLGMSPDELITACTNIRIFGDTLKPLTKDNATINILSLAKFLYSRLFDWIVRRLNESLVNVTAVKWQSIGILDIFGFEIFENNSFEQLCINYTNEKLQEQFNRHTFHEEQKIEKFEIPDHFVERKLPDNTAVIEAIEGRDGIIVNLSENVKLNQRFNKKGSERGTDKDLKAELDKKLANSRVYNTIQGKDMHFQFEHYAGPVEYNIAGFVAKSADKLNADILRLLANSKEKFVQDLFSEEAAARLAKAGSRTKDLGAQFSKQLRQLMLALNATTPHYIRCIKPNDEKARNKMTGQRTLDQLTYSGTFEAVKIRKQGYPFKVPHEEFVKEYKCILEVDRKTRGWQKQIGKDWKKAATRLIQELKQDPSVVLVGKTRVLYRAKQHRNMELKKNRACDKVATLCKSFMKSYLVCKLKNKMRKLKSIIEDGLAACDANLSKDPPRYKRAYEDCQKIPMNALKAKLSIPDFDTTCQGLLGKDYKFGLLNDFETKRKDVQMKYQIFEKFEEYKKQLTAKTLDIENDDTFDEICAQLDLAREAGMLNEGEKIPRAIKIVKKRVDEVTEIRRARKLLVNGTEYSDKAKLEEGLKLVRTLSMIEKNGDISRAKTELARIEREEKVMRGLVESVQRGAWITDAEANTINEAAVVTALRDAEDFGMKTTEGKFLQEQARWTIQLRVALKSAVGEQGEEPWFPIDELLKKAFTAEPKLMDVGEFITAEKEAFRQLGAAKVIKDFHSAAETFNFIELHSAYKGSQELGMTEEEFDELTDYVAFYEEIKALRDGIQQAMDALDETALKKALETGHEMVAELAQGEVYIEEAPKDDQLLLQAKTTLGRLTKLNADALQACRLLKEELANRVIAGAREIGLERADHREGRRVQFLIEEMQKPKDQLLRDQLDAAHLAGDWVRKIEIHLEIRKRFCSARALEFSWNERHCDMLKVEQEWQEESWNIFTRGGRRYYEWEGKVVHAPLSKSIVDGAAKKRAETMFKSIMGFMGDKQMGQTDILAMSILREASQNPAMKVEIYCQLFKQLTNNNDRSGMSRAKGWNLLQLLLDCLKLPPNIENHVEQWIRSNQTLAMSGKRDDFLTSLSMTRFLGDRVGWENEQAIQNILGNGGRRPEKNFQADPRYVSYMPEERSVDQATIAEQGPPPFAQPPTTVPPGGSEPSVSEHDPYAEPPAPPIHQSGLNVVEPPAPPPVPKPWKPIPHGESVYYWNEDTDEVTWDPPMDNQIDHNYVPP